jgi:nucleoside-diphosphate-sugar epimerase
MPELRPTPTHTIVTGAAGWLGQALMHRLRADGTRRHIHALVRDRTDAGVFAGGRTWS